MDTSRVWQRCEAASAWVGTFILFLLLKTPRSTAQRAFFGVPTTGPCAGLSLQLYIWGLLEGTCISFKRLCFCRVRSISKSGNTALWSLLKPLVRMMSSRMRICFCQGQKWRLKFILVCFYLLLACILLWNTGCSISLQKFTNDVLEIGFSCVLFKGTYCANTCMSAGSV